MNDREKLIQILKEVEWNNIDVSFIGYKAKEIIADHLITKGVVIQKQGEMDSFDAIDKFRDELMNKFMKLCNYNDFGKLRLEKIADTVNDVYDKCIDDLLQTAEQR